MPLMIAASDIPANACRRLLRAADRASLSTLLAAEGAPYSSLVLLACTLVGEPLLLLSDLADHTKNLKADRRASLLLDGTAGLDDPLTGARASLQGRVRKTDEPLDRARFVRRHPSAEVYAGFGDFNLYKLVPDRAHLVVGFGRIGWVEAGLTYAGKTRALAEAEAEILAHMNADHLDAVALYANRLCGRDGIGWSLTGIDPEGCDLRRQGETTRLPFENPVHDAETARVELVRLAKRARSN